MVTETISVPEVLCDHCNVSIEGRWSPIAGVQRAAVDIPRQGGDGGLRRGIGRSGSPGGGHRAAGLRGARAVSRAGR